MTTFRCIGLAFAFAGMAAGVLLLFGEKDDEWRKQQGQLALSNECIENLQRIKQLLDAYKRQHRTNAPSLLVLPQSSSYVFRCRLAYDITRTVFSFNTLTETTNSFSEGSPFADFAYAYVLDPRGNAEGTSIQVFCVALHPKVHVLLRSGEVGSISSRDFTKAYAKFPREYLVLPTNHWTSLPPTTN